MFSCTPSVFRAEEAEILRLMTIYHRGNPPREDEGGDTDGWE